MKSTWGIGVVVIMGAVLTACGDSVAVLDLSNDSDIERALHADDSSFEPEIGKGVDDAQTRTYIKCVVFPAIESQPAPGFRQRLYDEYNVQSRQDVDSVLGISASLSAKGLWGSASGSASYFRNLQMSEDSFFWLVDARYELQHESINTNSPQFQLTDLAKRILSKHGIKGFTKACGTHFYVGRTLGARYNLIYEFRSHEDKFVEKVKAAAKFNASFGLSGEADLNNAINTAKKASMFKVHSGIEGGGPSIEDYAQDAGALKRELARLRDDLFTHRLGEVLKWELVSYDVFDEVQDAKEAAAYPDLSALFKKDALALYYTHYIANRDKLVHLSTLLDKADGAEPLYAFGSEKRRAMHQLAARLNAQNAEIASRATQCLNDPASPCSIKGLERITDVAPEPDGDFSGLGTWSIHPVPRRGTSFIDFYGHPRDTFETQYSGRMFSTDEVLLDLPAGATVMASMRDGKRWPVVIGTFDLFEERGVLHPKLCVDEYASVCTLRIVEDSAHPQSDGYPTSRMQLVVYDSDGFQTDRFVFRIKH